MFWLHKDGRTHGHPTSNHSLTLLTPCLLIQHTSVVLDLNFQPINFNLAAATIEETTTYESGEKSVRRLGLKGRK